MTIISDRICRRFPQLRKYEWWVEQAQRAASTIIILMLFLMYRDVIMVQTQCYYDNHFNFSYYSLNYKLDNHSLYIIENASDYITNCTCVAIPP